MLHYLGVKEFSLTQMLPERPQKRIGGAGPAVNIYEGEP